jgi:hypothetical protein
MLQNVAAEIINCYERARHAREKAGRARSDQFKADFLAAESRWLALAYSYEHQRRLSRTLHEFDRRRKAGAITRMLREQGVVFDPDDVTRLTILITQCSISSVLKIARMAPRSRSPSAS